MSSLKTLNANSLFEAVNDLSTASAFSSEAARSSGGIGVGSGSGFGCGVGPGVGVGTGSGPGVG